MVLDAIQSAPRGPLPVKKSLEISRKQKVAYIRKVCGLATRESKEFFEFSNSYATGGKLWLGSLSMCSDLFSSRFFPNDSRVSSTHEGRLALEKKGGGE